MSNDGPEIYIKLTDKTALDWLTRLIDNTLNQPTHPTTIAAFQELTHWHTALTNPLRVQDLVVPEAKPVTATKKSPPKRKKREPVESDMFTCAAHLTYGGKRRPRTDCEQCWSIYKRLHPAEYAQKRRAFDHAQRNAQAG